MLVVCSPIFVAFTKIIFRYDFVAPLMTPIDSIMIKILCAELFKAAFTH